MNIALINVAIGLIYCFSAYSIWVLLWKIGSLAIKEDAQRNPFAGEILYEDVALHPGYGIITIIVAIYVYLLYKFVITVERCLEENRKRKIKKSKPVEWDE